MCQSPTCPYDRKCTDCGTYVCERCFKVSLNEMLIQWHDVLQRLKDM